MRSRFRFSIRLLLVLPLLVAIWLAGAKMTQRYGTTQVSQWLAAKDREGTYATYEAPFLLSTGTIRLVSGTQAETNKQYYLWLFGAVLQIPLNRKFNDTIGPGNSFSDIGVRRLQNAWERK